MDKKELGIAGSIILFIGVFTPIVSVPILGSLNYFRNGEGDGAIVLILATIAFVLALTEKLKYLWIPGLGSLGVMLFTFLTFMSRKSQLKTEIFSKAEGNPLLRGIAGMAMESVQLQWGWAIMFVGASLTIVSSLISFDVTEGTQSGTVIEKNPTGEGMDKSIMWFFGVCIFLITIGWGSIWINKMGKEIKAKSNTYNIKQNLNATIGFVKWSKQSYSEQFGINKSIYLEIEFENKKSEPIKAFQGEGQFFDKLGDRIHVLGIYANDNAGIKGEDTKVLKFRIKDNFSSGFDRLFNQSTESLRLEFFPEKIVFGNGKRIELPSR